MFTHKVIYLLEHVHENLPLHYLQAKPLKKSRNSSYKNKSSAMLEGSLTMD